MNRFSKLLRHPNVRDFTLLHLVDHEVAEHDKEWFARCQLYHTAAFPYLMYDLVRLVLGVAVYQAFFPITYTILLAICGGIIVSRQYFIEKHVRDESRSHIENFKAMRNLIIARAVVWGLVLFAGLSLAPPNMILPLVAAGMFTMFIDGLCMIAMPRRALLTVAIHSFAIAIPLISLGTGGSLLTAVIALCAIPFMHWAVFNLNYMFATRRLRTRAVGEANETIQILLNQYDEEGSDWLIECDKDGRILRPNERFCKAANRTAEEMDGLRLSLLFDPSPERVELREIGMREDPFRDLVLPLTVDGKKVWWSIAARPIYDDSGALTCWRGFMADVTRTREAEDKVTFMAHYDVLTNLPNRSLFNTTLSRAFNRRNNADLLAVLYIDLDHFKSINDTYGHSVGDGVLAEAGQRIERAVNANAMVARLGGDEFAVLLDKIDSREDALNAAQAIVTAMDEAIMHDGQQLPLGASVGVAFAPDNGLTGEDVLQAADLALYDAKARGRRGASLFDPAMQEQVQERRSMELDLRAALKRGELAVYYQPLLDAKTGNTAGYEALLRWQHPERGLIPPDVFIPIAEDTGDIIPIGAWVLREALMEASSWPDDLFISVNLSPMQMRDEGLINTIIGALASSGIQPNRLELEITETTLMTDSEENLSLLHKIRGLGVNIALDDFGTGYSSLNYLRSFPFDKIKIDRCFVADLGEKDDSQAIVQAVIGLASKLNMRTTAEGVENESQFANLRAQGCSQVQGFLFSKAKPANQLPHSGKRADFASRAAEVAKLEIKKRKPAARRNRKAG